MSQSFAAHSFERNSRFFLQQRDDFIENEHFNISLHHNGVESFEDSNISCGISKQALISFRWRILLSDDGFYLTDSFGTKIGKLECFYANKTVGSRYTCNQPYLQRWVIKREDLMKQRRWPIKTVVESVANRFD